MFTDMAEKAFPLMVKVREQMHRYPETGFDLPKTSALVQQELEALGLEVHTGYAHSGLVGVLRGANSGKTILLRADMDALPVQERVDVEYKSLRSGFMHACGHDGHTASLLGAAAMLKSLQDKLRGNVLFVFQPGEETEYGGAKNMIDQGVLDILPINAAFSGHLRPEFKQGEVHTRFGTCLSTRDEFYIKILGQGGYGSRPHLCIDPVIMTSEFINVLQALISRDRDPMEPVVLSVCRVNTPPGPANMIPDYVELCGTLRTQSGQVRETILARMHSLAKGICELYGGNYEFKFIGGFPEVVNNREITEIALRSAAKAVGIEKVKVLERPIAEADDFSHFSKRIPSSYVFIGTGEENSAPLHSAYFHFKHEVMKDMASVYASMAMTFLEEEYKKAEEMQ